MNEKKFLNGVMDVAGNSYHLKYNIRAIVIFEKLADKPFTLQCTTDWVILLYAMLLSGKSDAVITLDEFMDGISQEQLKEAIAWTTEQMKNEANTI